MSEFGRSPIEQLNNSQFTRVCHICKGELTTTNIHVMISSYKVPYTSMNLICNKCHVIYSIEDDKLIRVKINGNVVYYSKL